MTTSTRADVPPVQWDTWDYLTYLGLETLQPNDLSTLDRNHPLRSKCIFPLISREPKLHQLVFIAYYFSLVHSPDPKFNKAAQFIQADHTGLGKTTEMAMVIAYSFWASQSSSIVDKAGVSAQPHILNGFYAK
jgi:hypothetical protein